MLVAIVLSTAAMAAGDVELHAVGPPLTRLSSKLANPDWLVAWLRQPSKLRPGTLMPDFDMTSAEALAVARYLLAGKSRLASTRKWQGGDEKAGEKIFVSQGCRGCHAIRSGESSVSPRVPNLSGVGRKLRGDWIFNWIKSPRSYNPHTPMPQLALTDDEIRHLVAYLVSRKDGRIVAGQFKPGEAKTARSLVDEFECAKCHQLPGGPLPEPAYELSGGATSAAVLKDGRTLVEYFNCRGCHTIEGRGGAIAAPLERKSFAPPTLDGEGARVQKSWLMHFLQQPSNLRPSLSMRMPNFGFGDREAQALAKYFAALSKPAPENEKPAGGG